MNFNLWLDHLHPVHPASFVEFHGLCKVKKWTDEVFHLSDIAETHPHSAYSYCICSWGDSQVELLGAFCEFAQFINFAAHFVNGVSIHR